MLIENTKRFRRQAPKSKINPKKKKLPAYTIRRMTRIGLWEKQYRAMGFVPCFVCGLHVCKSVATLEHVIPLSKGGADNASNYAISHETCNQAKADSLPNPHAVFHVAAQEPKP